MRRASRTEIDTGSGPIIAPGLVDGRAGYAGSVAEATQTIPRGPVARAVTTSAAL
jgi:hypothetical protein